MLVKMLEHKKVQYLHRAHDSKGQESTWSNPTLTVIDGKKYEEENPDSDAYRT